MGIVQIFFLFLWGWLPAQAAITQAYPLTLYGARAIWQDSQTLTYQPNTSFSSSGAQVQFLDLENGNTLPVNLVDGSGLLWKLQVKASPDQLKDWARRAAVLVVKDGKGNEVDRTYFQQAALLDKLYHYTGCLGVCWNGGTPSLAVWAPTARSVGVVWNDSDQAVPMHQGTEGTWALESSIDKKNQKYLFEVEVFIPTSGKVEKHRVADPYAQALTTNSTEGVMVQLDDWQPQGWATDTRPTLANRLDAVIYELHVREFSQSDETVPENLRGTYLAFTAEGSNGNRHLKELADAGITHVHLMPVMDFASVDEVKSDIREPQIPANLPPDSPLPQEEILRVRSLDSFNWGYDPFHYFAPEGSYAVNIEGGARLKEFRQMIMALHAKGLRVVLDCVFNHTFASGLAKESTLDVIVPGYYYRLDEFGQVKNSSCCSDTASENWMMEKLMRDSVEMWRSQYHVDGFRFDLMNLHGVPTMQHIRDDLRSKDPSQLVYGEAWPFGSLLDKSPKDAYTISNAYGNAIGVFNDRLRDTLRGGTTNSQEKSDQGFVTGLYYDFNAEPANRNTPIDLPSQKAKLLYFTDVIRVGLAGSLRDYTLHDSQGNWLNGGNISFRGGVVGFAASPEESINYISAHDGYTLFDALQAKLPWKNPKDRSVTAMRQERLDRQILGVGLIALSQGMPLFDSGVEMLRSKSGDQNSYDSGDWFNKLDWTLQRNNWGVGLPQSIDNKGDWPFWSPRLADPLMMMGPTEIGAMYQNFLELIRLRKKSPLFRLRTADEIKARVHFLETELGPNQPPGVLIMEIQDELSGRENLDPDYSRMLVAVNVTNAPITFTHSSFPGAKLEKLYGNGSFNEGQQGTNLALPARTITVWGQRP